MNISISHAKTTIFGNDRSNFSRSNNPNLTLVKTINRNSPRYIKAVVQKGLNILTSNRNDILIGRGYTANFSSLDR